MKTQKIIGLLFGISTFSIINTIYINNVLGQSMSNIHDLHPPVISRKVLKRVFIKSAHGNYFLDHRIADRYIGLADKPYNPSTGDYDGELWEIVDAGNGRVFIKSAHGNYFLDHQIANRYIGLSDQPYNPSTGDYDGELWKIVDAGNGRVFIKSAHGNYFLDHRIADRYIGLSDQPYNPSTGDYNGVLWKIVPR